MVMRITNIKKSGNKYKIEFSSGRSILTFDNVILDNNLLYDKKIDGMIEIRDESDRQEKVRIVIDIKKDANIDNILNYLFKNTELQISYSYNMIAIVNRRPMVVGVVDIIDAYIAHQKEVITRRSKFDLEAYQKRLNIVDGFLKMMDILDEVIKTIRASKNKTDAKENLMKEFNFNAEQSFNSRFDFGFRSRQRNVKGHLSVFGRLHGLFGNDGTQQRVVHFFRYFNFRFTHFSRASKFSAASLVRTNVSRRMMS